MIIYNFTRICTLFIIQFLNSQRNSKSLRSAKVLAILLHFLSKLTRSEVAILWDNIREALNLRQEGVHGSQSQGSDLKELWYLCPDPFPPSGFSGLSSWVRSADEARLETIVLKMKY